LKQKKLNRVVWQVEAPYIVLMNETEALRVMSALAQATRMRVFVMLAKAGPVGMGSSDIADALGVPRNLMSSHLAVLSKAGAIASKKTGRAVIYTAVGRVVVALGDYLGDVGRLDGAGNEPAAGDGTEALEEPQEASIHAKTDSAATRRS
jgi:DNA-binding transcriptional ArsR family regulator